MKHDKEHTRAHFFLNTFDHETENYKRPNFNPSQFNVIVSTLYFFLKQKNVWIQCRMRHNFEILSRCARHTVLTKNTMGCLYVRVRTSPAAASAPVTRLLPLPSTCYGPHKAKAAEWLTDRQAEDKCHWENTASAVSKITSSPHNLILCYIYYFAF